MLRKNEPSQHSHVVSLTNFAYSGLQGEEVGDLYGV